MGNVFGSDAIASSRLAGLFSDTVILLSGGVSIHKGSIFSFFMQVDKMNVTDHH